MKNLSCKFIYSFIHFPICRVNAGVFDVMVKKNDSQNGTPTSPISSTSWGSFNTLYQDFEIGLDNPVDQKMKAVIIH